MDFSGNDLVAILFFFFPQLPPPRDERDIENLFRIIFVVPAVDLSFEQAGDTGEINSTTPDTVTEIPESSQFVYQFVTQFHGGLVDVDLFTAHNKISVDAKVVQVLGILYKQGISISGNQFTGPQ